MSRIFYMLRTYTLLAIGATFGAVGVLVFYLPSNIAPAGVTGISVILNFLIGTPIGVMIFILNIPIQLFVVRMMPGGWRNVFRVLYVLTVYSVMLDVLAPYVSPDLSTDNELLSAIFGGVLGGIGGGIIIRAGGNFGGTGTLALIIQRRTGMPLSSIYLYTDTLVIVAAGYFFGLNAALLAVVALFIDGLAANYILEGPSVIRTATIITQQPQALSDAIMHNLHRGVTSWQGQGRYTGETRDVLYVTVSRTQVQRLRRIVSDIDPQAFMVIGHGHTAYGLGFKPRMAPMLDTEDS